MLRRVRHFLEMIRFSHTIFALPFALLAAAMAWKMAHGERESQPLFIVKELVGILLCMIFARSAAMAFNRLVDQKIDAENPRTQQRHIPSGVLTVTSVRWFTAMSAMGFVASTLLFLPNRLPLYFSLPVLLFLCGYSFSKRFTQFAHFWLGAALMLAPVSAWIAIRGENIMANVADLLPAVALGGAVMFWVAGFDMIYACQDAAFDRARRLHSIPAIWGVPGALRMAAACHLVAVGLLATLPILYPHLGWIYCTGIAAVALLLLYEHALVRPDDLSRVNQAFFDVNAVISLGVFAVGCLDMWVR